MSNKQLSYTTANALARLWGDISERQVQLLASEGVIPKATRHGYDGIACTNAYCRYLKESEDLTNAEGLSEHLGLSTAMIYKLQKQGMPRIKRGKYDKQKCTQWYLQTFRDRVEGGESGDMLEERRLLIVQQRRKVTLEADLTEGKQMPMDAVTAVLMELGGIVVSQLDALPGRVACEVIGKKDTGEARQVIFKECRRLRDQIAGKIGEFTDLLLADLTADDSGPAR